VFSTGGNVVGIGLHKHDMSQNEKLVSFDTKNLNVDTTLPYEDESFDKVTCSFGVQYLTKPKELFAEIGRVLRPGGTCIMAFGSMG